MILIVGALLAVAAGSPLASEKTAVMVPVHQFVESFNMGDATTAKEGCSGVTSIVDDFPPHEWHGEGACRKWMESYRLFAKANRIDQMIMTLGRPRHIDVTADQAYVVVPVNYTLKRQGRLIKKTGSLLTFALRREAHIWCVVGWAWADG